MDPEIEFEFELIKAKLNVIMDFFQSCIDSMDDMYTEFSATYFEDELELFEVHDLIKEMESLLGEDDEDEDEDENKWDYLTLERQYSLDSTPDHSKCPLCGRGFTPNMFGFEPMIVSSHVVGTAQNIRYTTFRRAEPREIFHPDGSLRAKPVSADYCDCGCLICIVPEMDYYDDTTTCILYYAKDKQDDFIPCRVFAKLDNGRELFSIVDYRILSDMTRCETVQFMAECHKVGPETIIDVDIY